MIDEEAAKRLEDWIGEARRAGAKLLCGGKRNGNMLEATVLENVDAKQKVSARSVRSGHAAAEVRVVRRCARMTNDSDFGLQAGMFTNDLRMRCARGTARNRRRHRQRRAELPRRQHAVRRRQGSGLGREGIRYAIEDMTEIRLMVMRDP